MAIGTLGSSGKLRIRFENSWQRHLCINISMCSVSSRMLWLEFVHTLPIGGNVLLNDNASIVLLTTRYHVISSHCWMLYPCDVLDIVLCMELRTRLTTRPPRLYVLILHIRSYLPTTPQHIYLMTLLLPQWHQSLQKQSSPLLLNHNLNLIKNVNSINLYLSSGIHTYRTSRKANIYTSRFHNCTAIHRRVQRFTSLLTPR